MNYKMLNLFVKMHI